MHALPGVGPWRTEALRGLLNSRTCASPWGIAPHARRAGGRVCVAAAERRVVADSPLQTVDLVQPAVRASDWFFTESGQRDWVEAMELDTLTPDLPALLLEMGIRYDPERLADTLSSKWPQVYGRAVRIATSLGGFIARVARDYALGQVEARMADRCVLLVPTACTVCKQCPEPEAGCPWSLMQLRSISG
jgi:hypothetical protein